MDNTELIFILFLVIGLALLFCLGVVSAETNTQSVTDNFRINQVVNYAKPCYNNGTFCSSSAQCNLTVYETDSTKIINNKAMTNRVSDHNYTFAVGNIGVHKVDISCRDNGNAGAETFYYQVSSTGFNENIWFYVIIAGLGFVLIIWGYSTQDENVTLFGSIIIVFLGLYSWINGIAGIRNATITYGVSVVLIFFGAYILVRSALEKLNGE